MAGDGTPYGVRLIFCVIDNCIYFHCALEGQKIDNIECNKLVSFCVVENTEILPDKFATKYESAIVFPVMAVLQDVVLKRRRIFSKASVCYAGVAAVSLLLLVMRGRPATPSNFNIMGVTAGWQLSCSSAYFLLSHIWQWFWPFGNQEILGTFVWGRSVPLWMLGAAWAVLLFLAVACIALFRRLPEIAAGMLLAVAVRG